jgi:hypothetical protein
MVDLITLGVVGIGTYYLITSGTLDRIIAPLVQGGGAAGAGAPAAGGGGNARPYKSGAAPRTGSASANPGGNSPGWYTEGANTSAGSGWTGSPGHHHCDWKAPGCYCTDVPKCISSGTPPFAAGQCKPQWGTSGYVGGGNYPATADFSKCPPGTT